MDGRSVLWASAKRIVSAVSLWLMRSGRVPVAIVDHEYIPSGTFRQGAVNALSLYGSNSSHGVNGA